MKKEFIPTVEQKTIEGTFNGEILLSISGEPYRLAVVAPAGTGKTATALYVISSLQEIDPEKKIGYFVFNKFMKDEIKAKAYYRQIHNADFHTYHSFLLHHAINNEKLRPHFYDNEGKLRIDFQRSKYASEDLAKATDMVIGTDYHIFKEMLEYAIGKWIESEKDSVSLMREISKEILGKEDNEEMRSDKIEYFSSYSKNIIDTLRTNKKKMMSRLKGKGDTNLPDTELLMLFLYQGQKALAKIANFTKSAYYKEVATLIKKLKIDIFEEYDGVIVDEWQDADPIFKELTDMIKTALMVVGDPDQGIYGFRGALNMMEWAVKNYDTLSIPYSFRYPNDIAYLSQLINREKETPSESLIYGRYVPEISTIHDEVIGFDKIIDVLTEGVDKSMKNMERETGDSSVELLKALKKDTRKNLSFQDLKKYTQKDKNVTLINSNETKSEIFESVPKLMEEPQKEIRKEDIYKKLLLKVLSRDKTAVIARNNATLIEAIFNTVPKLRENIEKKLKKEAIVQHFEDALSSTINKKTINNLIKGIFPENITQTIEMYKGESYAEFKKGKTLRNIYQDKDVMTALAAGGELKPLSRKTFIKKLETSLAKINSGSILKIALSNSVAESFKNIRKLKFPKRIEKKLTEELGQPFSLFKKRKSLEDVLRNENVKKVLRGTEFKFLTDENKIKHFNFIAEELSSRSPDSIKTDDSGANVVYATIHATKGKTFPKAIVLNDVMKPDQEGKISEEEYNLSYVAVSRVENKLYFGTVDENAPHYLHDYVEANKEEINRYLKEKYTYTFPMNITMTINKMGEMYSHTFMREDEFMGACVIDNPIGMGAVFYNIENEPKGIRYYAGGKGYTFLDFEGESLTLSKAEREHFTFHYGTGETTDKGEKLPKQRIVYDIESKIDEQEYIESDDNIVNENIDTERELHNYKEKDISAVNDIIGEDMTSEGIDILGLLGEASGCEKIKKTKKSGIKNPK